MALTLPYLVLAVANGQPRRVTVANGGNPAGFVLLKSGGEPS